MKTLEKVLAILICVSLTLKFNLIPGGDYLWLWTSTILAAIYYPLGFLFFNQIRLRQAFKKEAYKNTPAKYIVFGFVTGLGLSIICIGSVFKLLDLPGANNMLIIGTVITISTFVISLILFFKKRSNSSKFIIWRTSIAGIIGLILFLTPSLLIVKFQYRNHPDYIKAYSNYLSDPKNETFIREKELQYYKIRLTKEEFEMYKKTIGK